MIFSDIFPLFRVQNFKTKVLNAPKNLLLECLKMFRKRETLNFMMCADSSTDTKTNRRGRKEKNHMSCVRCHISYVMCQMSCIIYHVSLVTNANSYIYPYPCYPHIMYKRLICKDQKTQKIFNTQKIYKIIKI